MKRHKYKVHIRFSDMDAFGHVNNACYLTYFEEARVSYFNEVINWQYEWSKQGIILARAELDFVQPVYFTDETYIFTRCKRLGNKSFDMDYQLVKFFEDKEILLASATTVMVMYDYTEKKSIPLVPEWREALIRYENNPEL